jgi:putative ABC transport system substrate-binding protein
MRRREFLTLVGGAAASPMLWPVAARAQQAGAARRVGVLMNYAANQREGQAEFAAFMQALRQLGWNEGQNLRVDVRWNAGDVELAKIYAAQLIGLMPDVILAASTINLAMIQQATNSVPVVFIAVTDPVEQGIVPSLTHPGGNVTGLSNFESSVGGKWLNLLKQVAPGLTRVGILFNPDEAPQSRFYIQAIETAGRALGVKAVALPVRTRTDIDPAVENFAREPNGGLMVLPGAFLRLYFAPIAALAAQHGLPSIGSRREFVAGGALMSYSSSILDEIRGAAGYVDRILKGAKAGDLPVQLSAKFQLVINLTTAKALGLTIPDGMVLAADEVLE